MSNEKPAPVVAVPYMNQVRLLLTEHGDLWISRDFGEGERHSSDQPFEIDIVIPEPYVKGFVKQMQLLISKGSGRHAKE